MQQQHPQPVRPRYLPAAYGSAVMQRPPAVVVEDPDPPPASELLAESDFTYLGSFRMPASVSYGGTTVSTAYNTGAIAYRGKGGTDRVLMTSHTTTPVDKVDYVYEVTVPALLTSAPYNIATLYKAWGDVYQGKRIVLNGGATYTNQMFIDDQDWDALYWSYAEWYDGNTSDRVLGKTALNDSTTTPTVEASWRIGSYIPNHVGTGICRINDSDFVTANCPGLPFMAGFGGAGRLSTAGLASNGPCYVAIPVPIVGTHADGSQLPATELMRHARLSGPIPGEESARRPATYQGKVFGICNTGTNANRIILQTDTYAESLGSSFHYNGKTCRIYSGAGTDSANHVMTLVSGGLTGFGGSGDSREYTVSPPFPEAPEVGVSKYEIDHNNWTPGYIDEDTGVWTFGDDFIGSTVWVGGNPHGVIGILSQVTDRQFYGPGGPHYESMIHRMLRYDPDDLADGLGL
jgi:hypothetical protein